MSADFWAGYISGAVGILIGNPLDVLKVRLQAAQIPSSLSQPLTAGPTLSTPISHSTSTLARYIQTTKSSLITGTAAPVIGYGALNALLFVAYNRTEDALNHALLSSSSSSSLHNLSTPSGSTTGTNLWTTWLAGAVGGLATWVISTPTELIKCRAQLAINPSSPSTSSSNPSSSFHIAKDILRNQGIRGLYHGGIVTALRDSIGYGFYFWAYELGGRVMTNNNNNSNINTTATQETLKVLLCGGVAGVVTWASVFPLDVIKTRLQGQVNIHPSSDATTTTPLLGNSTNNPPKRKGAVQIAREAYREGGTRVFFRGLLVCSVRAFVVNAVQWAVYEWIMLEIGKRKEEP